MNKILEQSLLYDFYGELLTEHQRSIYEDFFMNDLSLSEIADEKGISRQGVHDLVKRCNKTLEEYERKLHLVEKFLHTKELVAKIHEITKSYRESHNDLDDDHMIHEIEEISHHILEDL